MNLKGLLGLLAEEETKREPENTEPAEKDSVSQWEKDQAEKELIELMRNNNY